MRLRLLSFLLAAVVANAALSGLSFLSLGKPLRRGHTMSAKGTAEKLPADASSEADEAPQVEFDLSFFGVLILALPLIAILAGRFE